jgi:prepilin-type N-terminal cleavage/methylation domain-containing protein
MRAANNRRSSAARSNWNAAKAQALYFDSSVLVDGTTHKLENIMTPYPRRTSSAQGFTLIELLVVISIIALLVSILLPALGAARKTAVMLTCSTQHRSIAQATHMYMTDNNTYYPMLWDPYSNRWVDGWTHWTDVLNPYLGLPERYSNTSGSYAQVSYSVKQWKCPALEEAGQENDIRANQNGTYGVNPWAMPYGQRTNPMTTNAGYHNGEHPNQRIKEAEMRELSSTILTRDRKGQLTLHTYEFVGLTGWTGVCQPHFRTKALDWKVYPGWELGFNDGLAAMSFLDGHADTLTGKDHNQGVGGYENWIIP